MNRLFPLFIYTLFLALLIPSFAPHLRLTFFAPFLIFTFYSYSRLACTWIAFFSGLVIDLLSAQNHLGIYALNYCLTVWLLYPCKNHFFQERLSTLPLMTFFFAVLLTLLEWMILGSLGPSFHLSWSWFVYDLIALPLQDALYAFALFTLPIRLVLSPLKRSIHLFRVKRKRELT